MIRSTGCKAYILKVIVENFHIISDGPYIGVKPDCCVLPQKTFFHPFLHLRYDQYKDWNDNGDPILFWLSGLHIPESLLSSLVQTCSRSESTTLNVNIQFDCKVSFSIDFLLSKTLF